MRAEEHAGLRHGWGLIMANHANGRDGVRPPRHAGNSRYFGVRTTITLRGIALGACLETQ